MTSSSHRKTDTKRNFFTRQCVDRGSQAAHYHPRYVSKDLAGIDETASNRVFLGALTVAIEPRSRKWVAIILKKSPKQFRSNSLRKSLSHRQAHPLETCANWKAAVRGHCLFALQRPGHYLTRPRGPQGPPDRAKPAITVDNIQKTVAEYYKTKVSTCTRKNAVETSLGRASSRWHSRRTHPDELAADIGDAFGNRDHTPFCMRVALSRRCERRTRYNRDYHRTRAGTQGVNKLRATLKRIVGKWRRGVAASCSCSTTPVLALYEQLTNPKTVLPWLCRVIHQRRSRSSHNQGNK